MAVISGGDMLELTLSNADAGSKHIYGLKGEESTYTLQGFANDIVIDGGGRLVVDKELTPGSIECTVSNDMGNATAEFEFVQACCNSVNVVTATFALSNGMIYSGGGAIQGQPELNGKKSKFTFKMFGDFKKQ